MITKITLPTASILVVACLLLSCNNGSIRSQQRDQVRANVARKEAVVKEEHLSANKIKDVSLKEPTDLTAVQFLDDDNAWLGGKEKVFKTQDGGRTWQQVKLEVLPGSSVRRINFVSPMIGWIIFQRSADTAINYQLNHFRVLHTVDGGNTWSLQYDGNEAAVTDLLFTDKRNGWITGLKFGGLSPYRYTYLILHTKDGGVHWEDVSPSLIKLKLPGKEQMGDRINEAAMGVTAAPSSSAVKILTSENEIFTTADDARSWETPVVIDNKSEHAGIRRFGSKADNHLWFITSTNGREGTWSTFEIEQNQNAWSMFMFQEIYLTDVVPLNDRHFIASGFVFDANKDNDSARQAVLLHTPDDGQTWSVIYRDKKIPKFNSLHFLSPGTILAVGDNGSALRLHIDSLLQTK